MANMGSQDPEGSPLLGQLGGGTTVQRHATEAAGRDGASASHSLNGVAQTSLLIIANLAGAGILSLPKAINGAGIATGTAMVVAAALLSAYTADILSRCYDIINLRERQGDGKAGAEGGDSGGAGSFFARSPYACIGQAAAGAAGAAAVTIAQFMTQFSVMVVFFLICGINIHTLAPSHPPLFYSLICTAALTPLMLLRPSHVWGTALLAIIATTILVVVIIVLCATNAPHDAHTPMPTVTFSSLGTSFGVILFGFGGHAILPALQATMANPTPARFRRAIFLSFATCTVIYLSTAIASVVRLGGTVSGDVLTNFDGSVANDVGLVSVTAHLLFAAVTVHIPVGQILDHYCGATDLSARQVAIRLATMTLVALVIWAAGDRFFCVIGLVGGTFSNAMIFIYPPWFFLKLADAEHRTPALKLKLLTIMAIGTAGMISALIGAVQSCE